MKRHDANVNSSYVCHTIIDEDDYESSLHTIIRTVSELAAGPANLIPVYREFAADLETPVSVYLKLMDELGSSFLLESVEGGEQVGRYSFVGVNPRDRLR